MYISAAEILQIWHQSFTSGCKFPLFFYLIGFYAAGFNYHLFVIIRFLVSSSLRRRPVVWCSPTLQVIWSEIFLHRVSSSSSSYRPDDKAVQSSYDLPGLRSYQFPGSDFSTRVRKKNNFLSTNQHETIIRDYYIRIRCVIAKIVCGWISEQSQEHRKSRKGEASIRSAIHRFST